MPRYARMPSESGYYHVVNRGIGKQILFEEEEDYERFLDTLKRYQKEEPFDLIAYCLMDNHFHLLLHTEAGLDRVMKRISCSYAYYFNQKYGREGHLFQDRFRSEPITDETYLLAAVRYIHNNPQKAGICSREEYPWSSWQEYVKTPDLVNTEIVLSLVGGTDGFLELSNSNEALEGLDISERSGLSDAEALALIKKELHLDSGTQLQDMSRPERDAAIRYLKENNLSIRQIERLTGINRGVVLKA